MTAGSAFRVAFPEDEAREAWLPLLLDAYAALDAGLAAAVAASGRRPACRAGCTACCRQPIPASSLEVLGLTWFVYRHSRGRRRRSVRRALATARESMDCPFLVEEACAAYAVRPLACREFVVFDRPCRPGEQPVISRPGDVLPLPAAAQRRAFWHMLPYYGLTDQAQREAALRARLVLRDTDILQGHDWSWLIHLLA